MKLVKDLTPKELFKQVALDIGKQVAHHIETMYPDAVEAESSTFLLSVRNCTYNEIMAALDVEDWEVMVKRLGDRKDFRRKMGSFYRSIRRKPTPRFIGRGSSKLNPHQGG